MGVTIPDTPDYGTPVPRATTGVQSYGVTQPVQQDVAAWTYAANSAKAASDSDAAVMKETAAAVDKWSASIDTTMAQDALNQLRGQRQELTSGEGGFMKVQGGKVLEKDEKTGLTIYESYPAQLQAKADELAQTLKSPGARKLYQQHAASEILGYKAEVSRHGLGQAEKFQDATDDNTLKINTDRAIPAFLSGDPKQIETAIAGIVGPIRSMGSRKGVPTDALEKDAISRAAKMAVEQALDTGDTSALGLFDQLKPYIDPKDHLALNKSVTLLRETGEAQQGVRGVGAPTSVDPKDAKSVLRQAEGFRAEPYMDSGTLRIGFGSDTVTRADGRVERVTADTRVTKADAERDLARRAGLSEKDVRDTVGADAFDKLSPEAKAALTSISYNYGTLAKPELRAVVEAARAGDVARLGTAVQALGSHNGGVNKNRRAQEAANITRGVNPSAAPNDNRVGDPLATQINDITSGKVGVRSLADAVNIATTPAKAAEAAVNEIPTLLERTQQAEAARVAGIQLGIDRYPTNPRMQAHYQAEANKLYTQRTQAITAERDALYVKAYEAISAGKDIPVTILSQFTPQQQDALIKQQERAQNGRKTVTDPVMDQLLHEGLTNSNENIRQGWAAKNLLQYRPYLSEERYHHYLNKQAEIRKGDDAAVRRDQEAKDVMNGGIDMLGLNKPPSKISAAEIKQVEEFKSRFRHWHDDEKKAKGQPLTLKELENIRFGLIKQITLPGGWFGQGIERSVTNVTYEEIPRADLPAVEATIRRSGGIPTKQHVLELWIRDQARKALVQDELPNRAMPAILKGTVGMGAELSGRSSSVSAYHGSEPEDGTPRSIAAPTRVTPLMQPSDYSPRPPRQSSSAPDDGGTVRDRYQRAMSVPSKDLATMAVGAKRQSREK